MYKKGQFEFKDEYNDFDPAISVCNTESGIGLRLCAASQLGLRRSDAEEPTIFVSDAEPIDLSKLCSCLQALMSLACVVLAACLGPHGSHL